MHWKLVIAALTLGVLAGCTREKDEVSQLGVSRSQRVLLHVPAAYKIVNETLTLLVLRAGQVRVAIHRIDQNNFRIVKASKTQMAANVRTTQFGDIVVPATGFQVGETSGWKFAILDKDTRRPKLVEYLLTVNGGHVRTCADMNLGISPPPAASGRRTRAGSRGDGLMQDGDVGIEAPSIGRHSVPCLPCSSLRQARFSDYNQIIVAHGLDTSGGVHGQATGRTGPKLQSHND